MDQRKVGTDYQCWICKLIGCNFTIQYRPGSSNRVADALSREFIEVPTLNLLVTTCGVDWTELQQQLENDPFIQKLQEELKDGNILLRGYTLEQGVVRHKGMLVLPPKSIIVDNLLTEYIGGHAGEFKTYQHLANEWFWVGLRKYVAMYVQKCTICQQQKHSTLMPAGLLQPLSIPTRIWDLSIDLVEGLPRSMGFDTVLVVVDRITKYNHFLGISHPFICNYSCQSVH